MAKSYKKTKTLKEYAEYRKTWAAGKRAEREAAGLCTRCGKRPPVTGRKLCEVCNETSKRYHQESYNDRLDRAITYLGGRCADCGGTFERVIYDIVHSEGFAVKGNNLFMTWDELKPELDKSILLCANCRRVREAK